MDKIILAGAREVIQMGNTWFDADTYLRTQLLVERREKGEQAIYVPPFDHPDIWSGAASMITEIEEDLEGPADVVICSVGGGGLLCGLMQGLENSPTTTVIAVETVGADSLAQALAAGELITLPGIASIATTLGATRVAPQALRYAQQKNVQSLVVTDKQACGACVRFADSERMMVEPACGASLAAVYDGYLKDLQLSRDSKVVIVVCGGAGVTIDMLAEWRGMT